MWEEKSTSALEMQKNFKDEFFLVGTISQNQEILPSGNIIKKHTQEEANEHSTHKVQMGTTITPNVDQIDFNPNWHEL